MATFAFTATDQDGQQVSGVRAAANRQEVIAALRLERLVVTAVTEEAAGGAQVKQAGAMDEFFHGRIRVADRMTCTRQLAALLKAGISLTDALHTIAHGIANPRLRKMMLEIRSDVQRGKTLTDAVRKHPEGFDQLSLSMIHAGESSGSLAQNIDRLASYLEQKESFRQKVSAATTYPKFVFGFFLTLTLGIFIFLMPKFKDIFAKVGAGLPLVTKIFMAISLFLRANWYFLIPAALSLYLLWRALRHTERVERWLDSLILKLPFVGQLALKAAVQRLAVTLSTLLANGIPLADALEIATGTLDNSVLEANLKEIRASIVRGRSMAESLAATQNFPRLFARMVHVGEESGSLSEMLDDIASYYEQEVDHTLSRVTAVIEPILIVGMGAIVLVTVIAIYLPIFKLGSTAGHG